MNRLFPGISSGSRRRAFLAVTVVATLSSSPGFAQIEPFGAEVPLNVETLGEQFGAVVARAPDDSFVVVWTSVGQDGSLEGIYLRRFSESGEPLGGEQQVNTHTANDQSDPDLAFLAGGGFVVVWDSDLQDGELRGIYGQIFDGAGQPVGSELPINATTAGDQNDAVVAPASGGGFLAAWETQAAGDPFEDLVVRLFDSAGQPLTGEIELNQTTAGDQEDLDLATDGTGGFVAVWESDGQGEDGDAIVARLLDPTGMPVGDEIAVNVFTTGDQHNPDLAVRPDGTFAVAWQDDAQGAFPLAFFRGFAADGTAVTGEVATDGEDHPRFLPRLDFADDGGPVVVWISEGEDGSGAGSRLRHFDATGAPLGASLPLNLETFGNQVFPHLATGGTSCGLAVWESDGDQDGSGTGVFARRLCTFLFSDGFESGDTSAWSAVVP
ncbi:MAG: hypothetical protein KDD47_16850 [Acidobacteria bacterium]|nr:hypothetical protein [Acidobacteriota bacterium]